MKKTKKTILALVVLLIVLGGGYYLTYPMRGVDFKTGGQALYGDRLFIKSPRRGDEWELMSRQTIKWDSNNIEDGHVLKLILDGPTSGVVSVIDGDQVQTGELTWNIRGVLKDDKPTRIKSGSYRLIGEVYDGAICAQSNCSVPNEDIGKLISRYKSGRFKIIE